VQMSTWVREGLKLLGAVLANQLVPTVSKL
jgi:hypothetical protein